MTLVIAEEEAGRVIMGADSAAGGREETYTYPELEKIVQRGPYLIGHCGNGRVGQVVNLLVEWPDPPQSGELLPFFAREVVPVIHRAVKDAGVAQEGRGILGDTTVLLVGLRGKYPGRHRMPSCRGDPAIRRTGLRPAECRARLTPRWNLPRPQRLAPSPESRRR